MEYFRSLGEIMKKKPSRKPKAPQKCQHHNPNPSITSLFQEVFDQKDLGDYEKFHEALNHSPAFHFMVETAQEDDVSMCCLISDAVRFGWKAGERQQECKKLEELVGYNER
jgi:hypothetical protein